MTSLFAVTLVSSAALGAAVPQGPTQLTVLPSSDTELSLAWYSNDSHHENGFKIEGQQPDGSWKEMLTVPPYHFRVFVGGFNPETSYTFRVCSFNSAGKSEYSKPTRGTTLAPGRVASPTGRNPRFLWTPEKQAVWATMKTDYDARRKTIGALAYANALTNYAEYRQGKKNSAGPLGEFAVWLYQVTGDSRYVSVAYRLIADRVAHVPGESGSNVNADGVRQLFCEVCALYEWLYPALTDEQRATLYDGLVRWSEWSLTMWRTGDSDQHVGQYFGLALMDYITLPPDRERRHWLDMTDKQGLPVGGLVATAADRSTHRNVMAQYGRFAAGGQWFESSEYDIGTVATVLLLGVEALQTALEHLGDHTDYFPEFAPLWSDFARHYIYSLTPDLSGMYQWGDDEHPRGLHNPIRFTDLTALHAAVERDNNIGPYLKRVLDAYYDSPGPPLNVNNYNKRPWSGYYWRGFNPSASAADYGKDFPPGHADSFAGMLHYHHGWGKNDSFFTAWMPYNFRVDHMVSYLGDFQLWRKGEWALTHPIAYGIVSNHPYANNVMCLAGLGVYFWPENRRAIIREGTDEYAYAVGVMGGKTYPHNDGKQPKDFIDEYTRSAFYLPSSDKSCDCIVIMDRTKLISPRETGDLSRYTPNDQKLIAAAPSLVEWIIHAPVEPSVQGNVISWETAKGQVVSVTALHPKQPVICIIDEHEVDVPGVLNWQKRVSPSETKWQARVHPQQAWPGNANPVFQNFLNVVAVSDNGGVSSTLVSDASGAVVCAAQIHRRGLADSLIAFGAAPDARVLSSGYTLGWTAAAASTTLYLCDLDPALSWSATVDGAEEDVFLSSGGVGNLKVDGTGSHSLQVRLK